MLSKKELEELRPWVAETVQKTLGYSQDALVITALDCISKDLSRQSATDQLAHYLAKEAPTFVATLYKKVLELKTAKLMSASFTSAKKRTLEEGGDEEVDNEEKPPESKKKRASRFAAEEGEVAPPDIQQLLENTRRQIEERKRQTQAMLIQTRAQVPTNVLPGVVPSLLPTTHHFPQVPAMSPASLDPQAMDKAKRMNELQARIQSQLMQQPGLLSGNKASSVKPTPLILDNEGRTVDNLGRAIQLSVRQPTLKANIRAQQRATFRQITEKKTSVKEVERVEGAFVDGRVRQGVAGRTKKQLAFNEPGKYVKQGQVLRAKAQLEALQTQIASVARKTGISSATKLALIAPQDGNDGGVPNTEWWDAVIISGESYAHATLSQVPPQSRFKGITSLIEHPVKVQPPAEPNKTAALPIILTSRERKKLRKQRRREAERDKQEKIQFGLIDKPEPKVRISNLMRVLGSEAVQDPTKVEAHVRAQMAERQRTHEAANLSRKLTPAQRSAKKVAKMKEDLSCGVHVTVYRVHDLSKPAIKFKVDMNAQQLHLTGCVMLFPDVNLVIVEGGPKALKKFKRLMMCRIKWKPKKAAADDDNDSDGEGHVTNMCSVVWEGVVHDRAFNDWRVRNFPTEPLARDHLKRHKIEHYWDLALSQRIVEQEEEES